MQGLLVILGNHEAVSTKTDELGSFSLVIVASRAVDVSVASTLERGLLLHGAKLPVLVFIVDSETPTCEWEDVAVSDEKRHQNTGRSKGDITAVQHIAGEVVPADGVLTAYHTIDLEQDCTGMNLTSARPSGEHRPVHINKSNEDTKSMKNIVDNQDEINHSCLLADGLCMACQEPVHVVMVPSDRTAFVHSNKDLLNQLLLVCIDTQHAAVYGVPKWICTGPDLAPSSSKPDHVQMEPQGLCVVERPMKEDLVFNSTCVTVFWHAAQLISLKDQDANGCKKIIMTMV